VSAATSAPAASESGPSPDPAVTRTGSLLPTSFRLRVMRSVRSRSTGISSPSTSPADLNHQVALRRLYDCRHTFATWAIESGVELWYLARVMGTSTVQIEYTYARSLWGACLMCGREADGVRLDVEQRIEPLIRLHAALLASTHIYASYERSLVEQELRGYGIDPCDPPAAPVTRRRRR
jgi:hypothetical protein